MHPGRRGHGAQQRGLVAGGGDGGIAEFAEHRPTRGMRNDGYAFATWLEARGDLPLAGALELAEARLFWTFPTDTSGMPTAPVRRTSRVAVERFPGGMLVRRGRRVTTLGRPSER